MEMPSILLVEDDEIDTEVVRRAFQQHKIANPLFHAVDGLSALELLRRQTGVTLLGKPYMILLDLNLPRMNGLTFLQELRQDAALQRSVVFILTTSADPHDIEVAYNEQVAGYILKANIGSDFAAVLRLLDAYQTLVVLPDSPSRASHVPVGYTHQAHTKA
jgi:CheY-like chemotaxis protein